jgi:hypothetical protein
MSFEAPFYVFFFSFFLFFALIFYLNPSMVSIICDFMNNDNIWWFQDY